MEEEPKPKKTRTKKPAAPKQAKAVEELVLHALTLVAKNPKAKWTGATVAALFPNKEPNVEAAVQSCLDANRPLLKQVGAGGALTSAGFELVADAVAPEAVGALAKSVLASLPLEEREAFIVGAISRTPQASADLTPLLEEAAEAAKADADARVAAAVRRRTAEEANQKALERAQQLIVQRQQARVAELLRLLEIERQKTPEPIRQTKTIERTETEPTSKPTEPSLAEDKGFRRDVTAQLASSWRATWEMNKPDAREFLESAMWNISGLKLVGEVGQRVTYSGRVHESVAGVFSGDQVKIVRPGWVLEEDAGEFVVLKAVVQK